MTRHKKIQYPATEENLIYFSLCLNKAESLPDVGKCLLQNVRLLFACNNCHFYYFEEKKYIRFSLGEGHAVVTQGESAEGCFPDKTTSFGCNGNSLSLTHSFEAFAKESGCHTFYFGESTGVFLIAEEAKNALLNDRVPIIRMVSEMLHTKMRMMLKTNRLKQTTDKLIVANKKLEEDNQMITEMLCGHKKTIDERTQALIGLNAKLVELLQFQSHNIREPLTRIMGLMHLSELMPRQEFFFAYWPLLQQSVEDMDNTIRNIIIKTEKIDGYESFSH